MAAGNGFGTEILHIELWTELDPLAQDGESMNPLTQEQILLNLREEAKIILSAMIYGLEFTYIPADKLHGVKEYVDIQPIAEIRFTKDNLIIQSTSMDNSRMYARMTFLLADHEQKRRESWMSLNISAEGGVGEGNYIHGMKEKKTALYMALKNAVRGSLNTTIINKPHKIRGEAILEVFPDTVIRAGTYITTARFKINIKEIVPYTVF
ncbi:MAG: hypothetical protein JW904_13770 [Spirochaetales bacterium]|nr:hypothetical protein [Spirochaetales bacterium]